MSAIQRGDKLLLLTGDWMTAASAPVDSGMVTGGEIVAAYTDDGEIRLPVFVSAVVEVWRDGVQIGQQLALWER